MYILRFQGDNILNLCIFMVIYFYITTIIRTYKPVDYTAIRKREENLEIFFSLLVLL